MTSFIFNNGTYKHRGVWHIVKGDVERETIPAKVTDYVNTYYNCKTVTHYPEHEIVMADIVCNSIPGYNRYGRRKALTVGGVDAGYSSGHSYRSKRHEEDGFVHERSATVRPLLFQTDPPYPPGPLCSNCQRSKKVQL